MKYNEIKKIYDEKKNNNNAIIRALCRAGGKVCGPTYTADRL